MPAPKGNLNVTGDNGERYMRHATGSSDRLEKPKF